MIKIAVITMVMYSAFSTSLLLLLLLLPRPSVSLMQNFEELTTTYLHSVYGVHASGFVYWTLCANSVANATRLLL